jgi:hypothetical protein
LARWAPAEGAAPVGERLPVIVEAGVVDAGLDRALGDVLEPHARDEAGCRPRASARARATGRGSGRHARTSRSSSSRGTAAG